jgi:endonuclease/exonuclease/phosphatase family metal-dependent hydrolase
MTSPEPAPALSVTTFNVHFGGRRPHGHTTYDLTAACRALPGTVRVFQEVWEHPAEPSRLWTPPGWTVVEHVFGEVRRPRSFQLPEPAASRHGRWMVVVATAHPVVDQWTIPLPPVRHDTRRSALGLRLATPAGDVSLVAVHLSSLFVPYGAWRQARHLGEHLPPGPLVVAGDHNLWAGAVARCYPGLTRTGRGGTWPAKRPWHQIDQIWTREVPLGPARVLPDAGSDHLAVTTALAR